MFLYLIALWWGLVLWLASFAITFQIWGVVGLVIGIILLGVGLFVTGLAALIYTDQTSNALLLGGGILIVVATSAFGDWISRRG